MSHSSRILFLLLAPFALLGCRKAKVEVYEIPKEVDAPPAPMTMAAAPAGMPRSTGTFAQADGGELTWSAPAEWKAKPPSMMRRGSYAVGPDESTAADLAISAFPGDVGGDLANVNRWLNQLGQPPVMQADLASLITSTTVGELTVHLVDLTGGSPESPQRMLGAWVPFDGSTWFFKLVGADAVVLEAKPAFLNFLQTIKGSEHDHASHATPAPEPATMADMANTAVRQAAGPGLQWTAPDGWQSQTPTAMRKATYTVTGAGGSAAELSVTAFPGDVGGELANVNRWRGQLQLTPFGEAELAPAVTRLEVHGLAVALVDFTGGPANDQRLLGAIVPLSEATWFFKFTGPPDLIEAQKAAFYSLINSLQNL
ncbi:MAG: hypothetical protein K9M98_12855 [Cephaloticoccus sp.]|nr:hypothetical protein [Cephaloticoccus sp.]MCF7761382.1 hypothetical protein [Cephaloticoccus sp.]